VLKAKLGSFVRILANKQIRIYYRGYARVFSKNAKLIKGYCSM
jgi:hypothetical protein